MPAPTTLMIVEDDPIIALALELAACEAGAMVAGPFESVADALSWLPQGIDAAILDANLLDGEVTPLAELLHNTGIPYLLHSGTGVPVRLAAHGYAIVEIPKPAPPRAVVDRALRLAEFNSSS